MAVPPEGGPHADRADPPDRLVSSSLTTATTIGVTAEAISVPFCQNSSGTTTVATTGEQLAITPRPNSSRSPPS
jgi:hypothetical protein